MPSKNTNNYRQYLHRKRDAVTCPRCRQSVLIKDYEGHCTKSHRLNARLRCVWCDGKRSWKLGQKDRMIDDHITDCLGKFLLSRCPPEIVSEETALEPVTSHSLLGETPKDSEKNFFGRSKLPDSHPAAYESVFEPDDGWWRSEPDPLTFSDENLDLAARCVRKFAETRGEFDWFHVMVTHAAFGLFHEAMESRDLGKTVVLPFWCWCDGGTEAEARFRQHRHMIVVSPRGHFQKNVWSKIRRPKGMRAGFGSRKSCVIEEPVHLANTIGYLSRRESRCSVSSVHKGRLNHFRINLALPKLSKWVLFSLWDATRLLDQTCNCLASAGLAPHAKKVEGSWKVPVRHLPKVPKDLVLPVSKHFKPTSRATRYFVHLTRDKRLYFEEDASLLEMDDEAWAKLQAESGNAFCHNIGNELWRPKPYHQKNINVIRAVLERNAELETETAQLKTENMQLKNQTTQLKNENTEADKKRIRQVEQLEHDLNNVKTELSRMKEADKKRKRDAEEPENSKRPPYIIYL